jgi:ribokinase
MKAPRIVVVGSANTDLVVRCPRIPAPGETVLGGAFLQAAGGKGANQAVAAARLGADVGFVARVGQDAFGAAALAACAAAGVATDHCHQDPAAVSGVALILVDDRGENAIAVAPGANGLLSSADIDRAADSIRTADLLVLQLEVPLDAVLHAAGVARAAGVPVLLDPAPVPDGGLPAGLLARTTILKPNAAEATRLTGIAVADEASATAAARTLRARGPGLVVVTLGAQGAVLVDDAGAETVPAFPVSAVDTTAAGDAFTGALAVCLAGGMAPREAARRAAAAGALAATRSGAQPSLPTRAEWEAFLRAADVG